jgi:NAD(P)-dependent dehydrogenase (short-subunit alcohol dehydrogenase family)
MRSWLDLPIALTSSEPTISSSTDDRSKASKNLKGKQILFVSSISGLVAMTPQFQAAYNASKAGVTMLAKVCHLEVTNTRSRLMEATWIMYRAWRLNGLHME